MNEYLKLEPDYCDIVIPSHLRKQAVYTQNLTSHMQRYDEMTQFYVCEKIMHVASVHVEQ